MRRRGRGVGMGVTDERVNLRGDVGTGGNNAGDLAKIAIGEPSHMRDIQPSQSYSEPSGSSGVA